MILYNITLFHILSEITHQIVLLEEMKQMDCFICIMHISDLKENIN